MSVTAHGAINSKHNKTCYVTVTDTGSGLSSYNKGSVKEKVHHPSLQFSATVHASSPSRMDLKLVSINNSHGREIAPTDGTITITLEGPMMPPIIIDVPVTYVSDPSQP